MRILFLNFMYCYCYHIKLSMFTLRSCFVRAVGLIDSTRIRVSNIWIAYIHALLLPLRPSCLNEKSTSTLNLSPFLYCDILANSG